ncbi:AraC family transcriptional regulator [Sphaerimonospora thailandensis]|uniref:Transcriptional regulator n=1 Tax=Sphaerimonospora thailandensis TaxID=795644 RepID=A0A8J3VWL1_9ACTN|nr:AraC family transcriptional regulator [Sphaerimonospora thailandensis]GIH67909.1 transcriptional regulator [Sphaerimonospora thailandensis]
MPAQPLPLATHELFHTGDLDEARALVGDAFAPHELCLGRHQTRFDARMNGAAFDRTGLYAVDYGGEALVTAPAWESCFLVTLPLTGAVEVSRGREQVMTTPEFGSVLTPTERMSMRWMTGAPHLVALFDRWALEAHLGGMLGRELHRPIRFSLGMDLTRPLARSWLSIIDLLRREAETDGDLLSRPLALEHLEGLLMTQLLLTQPSNYTPALSLEPPCAAPVAVKRAMELIEAQAAEPLTVTDIAEAAGVGVRALQAGFRRHVESTPTAYLRDVRLERARAELTGHGPGTATIADVARRWGFVHLGQFSRAYRERFGEAPSETLRR